MTPVFCKSPEDSKTSDAVLFVLLLAVRFLDERPLVFVLLVVVAVVVVVVIVGVVAVVVVVGVPPPSIECDLQVLQLFKSYFFSKFNIQFFHAILLGWDGLKASKGINKII